MNKAYIPNPIQIKESFVEDPVIEVIILENDSERFAHEYVVKDNWLKELKADLEEYNIFHEYENCTIIINLKKYKYNKTITASGKFKGSVLFNHIDNCIRKIINYSRTI